MTVEWFFGKGRAGKKAAQLVLVLFGWFFTVLPVVITASALLNRHNESGWWAYHEGFVMWDLTMAFLGILVCAFAAGFLVLHIIDRAGAGRRAKEKTYNQERLEQRLEIAADWYADKFGPEAVRGQQTRIQIEAWGDIETYELRGLYRQNGVA